MNIKVYVLPGLRLLGFLSLLTLANMGWAGKHKTLETVPRVNLDRYVGTWYEIARLPNWFQDQCIGDVTADYEQLGDGSLRVINRCLDREGMTDEARGTARVVDAKTNAKLEVSFVSLFGWNLFWGDYWILDIGDRYDYAVVGMPSRKYAWILSRTAQLSPEIWRHVRQVLVRAGYDPDKLVETRHSGIHQDATR